MACEDELSDLADNFIQCYMVTRRNVERVGLTPYSKKGSANYSVSADLGQDPVCCVLSVDAYSDLRARNEQFVLNDLQWKV